MRILIVNGQPGSGQSVQFQLRRAGHRVQITDNDPDRLMSALGRNPDLVLLDLAYSDLDGLSLCKQVRRRSRAPLIVIGPYRAADAVAALQVGADDYVPRPVNHREVLARAHALLRRARWQASARVDMPQRMG